MKLVVKRHRPVRRVLIGITCLFIAGGAVLAALNYGQWRHITRTMTESSIKRGLIEEHKTLKADNQILKGKLTRLERIAQVDAQARIQTQADMVRLRTEIAKLKQELDFYQDIIASTEPEGGPRVQGFQLQEFDNNGRYRYRLVLTHVNKSDKVAQGRVLVEFEGKLDGELKRLKFSEVSEQTGDLEFKFKHFRRFEGILKMPDSFEPEQVHIKISQNGRPKNSFSRSYSWAKVLN